MVGRVRRWVVFTQPNKGNPRHEEMHCGWLGGWVGWVMGRRSCMSKCEWLGLGHP